MSTNSGGANALDNECWLSGLGNNACSASHCLYRLRCIHHGGSTFTPIKRDKICLQHRFSNTPIEE